MFAPSALNSRRRQIHGIDGGYECLHQLREVRQSHRANTEERRQRRSVFVEAIIAGVDVLDFTISSARIHAEIHSELAKQGQMIGAHDLIIARHADHSSNAALCWAK